MPASKSQPLLHRFLHRISEAILGFWQSYIKSDAASNSIHYVDDASFRRTSAFFLGVTVVGLLFVSATLNIAESNYPIAVHLFMAMAAPVGALVWLFTSKKAVYGPLLVILFALTVLGGFLLMKQGAPSGSSLFWFMLFPPMCIFCLGVKYGSALFAAFYIFLCMTMLGPWQGLLAEPVAIEIRERFLLSLLGSYIFAGFSEVIRAKTNQALLRLMARLEQEALTDPLTGLGNRRDFKNHFRWVVAKAERNNAPFALAMVDIDHFKNINDTYGHDAGDRVLVHMANRLMEHMRLTDRLFRWGGEEFIILMPDINPQDALHVAERTRQMVEGTPCRYQSASINYTVSMGLFCGKGFADINDALAEADKNMYVAKQSGRNRVVADSSSCEIS